jgi:asparagine synthase (glutamine-hydrolysing)
VLIFGDIFSIKDREIKGECKAKTVIDIYKMGDLNNLKELNGTFVLMIRDGKRFILMNDQLGSLLLYYVPRKHQILFSSEIKAILEDPSISPLLNLESVVELLTFSFLLGNKSLLKGINLLPPSHMLICDCEREEFELRKYWDFKFQEETAPKCLEDYIKEFDFKFEKAIRRRILDKDRIGIFLSGGVDSRLLACYTKKIADRMGKTVLSFTFGTKNCVQKKIAKEVADKLGIENIFLELSSNWIENMANEIIYKGDGHLRIRDAHFVSCLREIREEVDIILAGYSCDNLFGTHLTNDLLRCSNASMLEDYLVKKFRTIQASKFIPQIFAEDIVPKILKLRASLNIWNGLNKEELLQSFTLDRVAHYWELRQRLRRYVFPLSNYINWYLEFADPYLDYEIIRFATSLPFDLKNGKFFIYQALKFNFPDLAQIEFERLTPLDTLSHKLFAQIRDLSSIFFKRILERLSFGKILFTPQDYRAYDYWIRTGSRRFIEQQLLLDLNSIFNLKEVKKIVKDHMNARSNNDQIICDILNLNLFLNEFNVKI